MSLDSPTSETRNRRRLAMAAAAVVAVLGVAAIAINIRNSDDDVEPAPAAQPTVAPTTVAPTTTVASKTVSFAVASANDIPVTFTAPENWGGRDGRSAYSGLDFGGAVVLFDSVSNIYTDGCQWTLLDPPVGPTVDDLVEAWAAVPELTATAAVDITVDGYAGKQIEITNPYYYGEECKEQTFGIYMVEGAVPPGRWLYDGAPHLAECCNPIQHYQMWVLDVDGTRLLIAAITYPTTTPQNRAALDEVLASIQIG